MAMRWCLTFLQPFDGPYNYSINKADGSSTIVKGSETASMVKYNFEKDDVKEHRGQVITRTFVVLGPLPPSG